MVGDEGEKRNPLTHLSKPSTFLVTWRDYFAEKPLQKLARLEFDDRLIVYGHIEPPARVAGGFPFRLLSRPKSPIERRYWAVS
jgi:hypothetical protein